MSCSTGTGCLPPQGPFSSNITGNIHGMSGGKSSVTVGGGGGDGGGPSRGMSFTNPWWMWIVKFSLLFLIALDVIFILGTIGRYFNQQAKLGASNLQDHSILLPDATIQVEPFHLIFCLVGAWPIYKERFLGVGLLVIGLFGVLGVHILSGSFPKGTTIFLPYLFIYTAIFGYMLWAKRNEDQAIAAKAEEARMNKR